ncbi:MAG: hypothetical protein VB959_08920 [Rhodospirillales bacterium]
MGQNRYFKPLAERGEGAAQNMLGDSYRSGNGVTQDLQETARWYRKAAMQGHGAAQCNLGHM